MFFRHMCKVILYKGKDVSVYVLNSVLLSSVRGGTGCYNLISDSILDDQYKHKSNVNNLALSNVSQTLDGRSSEWIPPSLQFTC